ncbi:MAG: hypothetical protein LBQ06_03265 [Frankiaceae bacterium]|nr:hypothetical protein [Frankiaceae bacterium]
MPSVSFTAGAWRDRIGWWRSLVVCFVVLLAAGAVLVPSYLVLDYYRQQDAATAQPPAANPPPQGAGETSTDAAAPSDTPSAVSPSVEPPPRSTAAPTQATGFAQSGPFSLSFVVQSVDLRAGQPVDLVVSATGDVADRVSSMVISTADGTVLTQGSVPGCAGPQFPWTQTFQVAFPAAESTQLQVQVASCAGGSLVATSLVDIQP